MLKQIQGSQGVAQAIALCRPEVICAYPISPQTTPLLRLRDCCLWQKLCTTHPVWDFQS